MQNFWTWWYLKKPLGFKRLIRLGHSPRFYGLDGLGIESPLGVRFSAPVQTGPWGPPNLLYNGDRFFPGVKAAGALRWPPTPSSAEVEGREELYICSPSRPSWPVIGRTLPLPFYHGSRWGLGEKGDRLTVAGCSVMGPDCIHTLSELRGTQTILDQLAADPWIHFCNGYLETHVLSRVQSFPAWHKKAAPNRKCCEGYIVPSMVRLMYQLKWVLK